MSLGAFSMSLSVRDLDASRDFYTKLGFTPVAGVGGEGWAILRCGDCTLGLFQGMFERNMLTFNPGWVSEEETMGSFEDVRALQARLKAAGIAIQGQEVDPGSTGPASFTVMDPDGNPVFFDQHVPAPTQEGS
ncbi:MAG: VOC family protein [Pseudomonadota bacterium]